MMKDFHKEIDLVYLWVNGNDPIWRAKRNTYVGKYEDRDTSISCEGRYADHNELKYSLRSIEMYAPWIRKIFIVTDNQIPQWLDTTNTKIKIIDHKEIMPIESLPCFNSSLIEHFLYKIPGLSEYFLIANDDTFINKEVTSKDFFNEDGLPIIRLRRKPFRKIRWWYHDKICKRPLKNYRRMIVHSSDLVKKIYGIYYTGIPHHNIDAYLKSDYQKVVEVILKDEFKANNKNKIRSNDDIHRSVISYIALAEKRGEKKYVTDKESLNIKIHRKNLYNLLWKKKPTFFCMNDSELATEQDRLACKDFLEKRFNKKSYFEL